jgi:hypothetical protein
MRERVEALQAHVWPEDTPTPEVRTAEAVIERLLSIGLWLALGLFLVQSALHLFDVYALDLRFSFIDADVEANLPSWLGVVSEFAAAFAALLLWVALDRWRERFVLLVGVIAFLSLDDMVGIHERVAKLDDKGYVCGACYRAFWPLVYLPLLALTFVLLWALARNAPSRARSFIRIGLGLLVLAIFLEAGSSLLVDHGWGRLSAPYELEVVLEEGAELVGWTLIATGVAAYACQTFIRLGRMLPQSRRLDGNEAIDL